MTLTEKLLSDFKDAMKRKDSLAVSVLSFLRAQVSYAALEKKKDILDDAECAAVIKKLVKQHQESIAQFVSTKLRDYLTTGSTTLSVNLPNLALDQASGAHRLAYLHRNIPGVLAAVNATLAEHGVNIEGQLLATRGDIGYVVTDADAGLEPVVAQAVADALTARPESIRLRVLS